MVNVRSQVDRVIPSDEIYANAGCLSISTDLCWVLYTVEGMFRSLCIYRAPVEVKLGECVLVSLPVSALDCHAGAINGQLCF